MNEIFKFCPKIVGPVFLPNQHVFCFCIEERTNVEFYHLLFIDTHIHPSHGILTIWHFWGAGTFNILTPKDVDRL